MQRQRRPRQPTALRTLRRSRLLSQEQLADLLGVSQQVYARYESGEIVPSADLQASIAAILGSSVEMLWQDRRSRPLAATLAPAATATEIG